MSNAIDSVVSKQAQQGLDSLYDSLQKTHKEIIEMSKIQLNFNGNKSSNTPQDFSASIEQYKKLNAQIEENNRKITQLEAKIKSLRATRQSSQKADALEIINQRELRKNADAEAISQSNLTSIIAKLSVERAKSARIVADYNALIALGNTLTEQQSQELIEATANFNKYDKAIKAGKLSIGDAREYVGQYERANYGLSNSINQLTRELPALGINANTFFLAISNNLPILADEISNLRNENRRLTEEGGRPVSILKQLAAATFSWQTLLSVGVTLLTLYGGKLLEMSASLFEANENLNEITESQLRYNEATAEGQKKAFEQGAELSKLTQAVRNQALSEEQRNVAFDKLMKLYPRYFQETDRALLKNGQFTKSQYDLIIALDKRSQSEAKLNANQQTAERIIDIENEIKAREEFSSALNKELSDLFKVKNQRGVLDNETRKQTLAEIESNIELLKSNEDLRKERRDSNTEKEFLTKTSSKLESELNQLYKENSKAIKEINRLYGESILLEKQDSDKAKREKVKLTFDWIRAEKELRLSILERQRAEISDRMNNENALLDQRIKSREEFSRKSIEILEGEMERESYLLTQQYSQDVEKNRVAYKNKELTITQYNKNVTDIAKRYSLELQKVDSEYSLKYNDLINSDLEYYKNIQKEKRDFVISANQEISKNEQAKNRKIIEDEENTLELRQKAFRENLNIARKELDIQKLRELSSAKSNEEIAFVIEKYKALNAELDRMESPIENARKSTQAFIRGIAGGELDQALGSLSLTSAKVFLDFDKNGESSFDKLIQGAKNTQEEFAISFKAIGDVAQEAFNLINSLGEANLEAQISRLEKQRDKALEFAGESESARQEIEEQFENRRADLRRKEAERQKMNAIFNVAINTAQAIVGALATLPSPSAVPLSIAVGAIGALQAGIIAAQPIPEFWKGTNNAPEGWAKVDEKRPEVHTDAKGNIKSLGSEKGANLRYLNKGDKIYKSRDEYFSKELHNIMKDNGISFHNEMAKSGLLNYTPRQDKGITASELESVIRRTQPKQPSGSEFRIKKTDVKQFWTDMLAETENKNNRYSGRGRKV